MNLHTELQSALDDALKAHVGKLFEKEVEPVGWSSGQIFARDLSSALEIYLMCSKLLGQECEKANRDSGSGAP